MCRLRAGEQRAAARPFRPHHQPSSPASTANPSRRGTHLAGTAAAAGQSGLQGRLRGASAVAWCASATVAAAGAAAAGSIFQAG